MNFHPVLRWVLWPLSVIYGAAAHLRLWCYRRGLFGKKRLDVPVISIGNLTVGGTGKTPMAIWLAERLVAMGKRPALLTRGHRPRRNPTGTSERTSDEVLFFRRRFGEGVPVGVGRDRYAAALRLQKSQKDKIDCFVLDDGFQYLKLQRDADVVLIDATNPFGGGFLLPAGPLRERPSALSRADLVVITRSEHSPAIESIVRRHSAAEIFYAQTRFRSVIQMESPLPGNRAVEFRQHRYLVFCGIGNPQAFRDDLARWGIAVLGSTFFRDHHRYTQAEADQLQKLGEAMGATALLCTEKDIFNLDRVQFKWLEVHFCRIELEINDEDRFLDKLRERGMHGAATTERLAHEAGVARAVKEQR